MLWQLAPYVALTLGEVLVSVTGLEFAYSQAPPSMKGAIQSFWLLTTFAGNLVVAVLARLNVVHRHQPRSCSTPPWSAPPASAWPWWPATTSTGRISGKD